MIGIEARERQRKYRGNRMKKKRIYRKENMGKIQRPSKKNNDI